VERKVDHANNTKELMQYESEIPSNYPDWSEHIKGLAWICGFVGAYHKSLTPEILLKLVLVDTRKYVKRSNFSKAKSEVYILYIEEWGKDVLEYISFDSSLANVTHTARGQSTQQYQSKEWLDAIERVSKQTENQNPGIIKNSQNEGVKRPKDDFSFANNHTYVEVILKGIRKYLASSNINFSNFVKREWKKKYPHIKPNFKFSKLLESISKHLKNNNLDYVSGMYVHSLMPKFKFETIDILAIEVLKFVYLEEEVIEDETELKYKMKD